MPASRREAKVLVPDVSKHLARETADPATPSVSGEQIADHDANHLQLVRL